MRIAEFNDTSVKIREYRDVWNEKEPGEYNYTLLCKVVQCKDEDVSISFSGYTGSVEETQAFLNIIQEAMSIAKEWQSGGVEFDFVGWREVPLPEGETS